MIYAQPASFGFMQAGQTRRGIAYVVILILVATVSVLGLVFLERSSIQETESVNRTQNIQAKYLAEAAANEAMYKLLNDASFPADSGVYYMKSLNGGRYGYRVRRQTNTTFATVAAIGAIGQATVQESYLLDILPPFIGPALNLIYDTNTGASDRLPWRCQFRNTGWLGKSSTVDLGVAAAYWVDVQSNPVRKELLMTTLDASNRVNVATFDGTFWTGPTQLTTAAGTNSTKVIASAYESQSGRGLVVYRSGTSITLRYSVWNGTSWSSPANGPTLANPPVYLCMKGSPVSDEILLLTDTDNDKMQLWRWNGSAFSGLGEIESDPTRNYVSPGAIAYESSSGRAIITCGFRSGTNCHYLIWNGSALSAAGSLPSFGGETQTLRLASDPTSDQILIIGATSGLQIWAALWNGSAWTSATALGSLILNTTSPNFDVAWLADGSQAILAWCTTLGLGVNYKLWTKGTAISSASSQVGPSCGVLPNSIRLIAYPKINRAELVMQDTLNSLYHSYFDGSNWSTAVQVTSSLANSAYQPYALAALKLGY